MDEAMEESMEAEMGEEGFGGRGPAARQPTRARTSSRSMLSEDANEALNKYLGLVATTVAHEFNKRYSGGNFGQALTRVSPPAAVSEPAAFGNNRQNNLGQTFTSTDGVSDEFLDTLAESAEPVPLWKPGILFYGETDSAEYIAKQALADKTDFLLHFDIFLKENRNGEVQNVSRCRMIQVTTGKSMGVSKGIDSNEAINLARTGRSSAEDYVSEQLSNLFLIVDRHGKSEPMPALPPEVAKRRISAMLSGKHSRSLRTLAEIRLYQLMGLITAEEAEQAFDVCGGEDAMTMMYGRVEDKRLTARDWAVKSVRESER